MPEFDPSANGHKSAPAQPDRTRGNGILIVSVVCAMTGFCLLIGGGLGTVAGAGLRLQENVLAGAILVGAAVGGMAGVFFGVKLAARFGGSSDAPRSIRFGVLGGLVGLAGAVGVASLEALPIFAIVLPGVGAWLGDRLSLRRR